jgi:Asp-tRNA(Asn)/Glu-tRNA(Gln) amidotransferase A subunit family amidase
MADLISMRNQWSDAYGEAGIDALVFPALPLPAMPHGISGRLISAMSYMFLANLLKWPCGAVPVTTVQNDEQHYRTDDLPMDQRDGYAKLADHVMKDSAGLPMSVSIMTTPFTDETCLRVMKEVERVVDFREKPTEYARGGQKRGGQKKED